MSEEEVRGEGDDVETDRRGGDVEGVEVVQDRL